MSKILASAATVEDPFNRLARIIVPYAMGEQDRVLQNGRPFVHYTSAAAAFEILKSRCFWMRNATCMNDFAEMRHGLNCLLEALRTDAGDAYWRAIDAIHSGVSGNIQQRFAPLAPPLLEHTYIACFSEHPADEEVHGRLSMWRAYGSHTGVALVLNPGPFLRSSNAFPAWTTPVCYLDAKAMAAELKRVADLIAENAEFLRSISRNIIESCIIRALIFAVISSKHRGFREEREWRVVHVPTVLGERPDRILLDQVCIAGIPQPIFKLPFIDYPDDGFYGATVPDLITGVIVGPTQYPVAVKLALAQLLAAGGVDRGESIDRVRCSDVTLRI